MLQRYIMEMSHLKSRRVKLTTGNTISMQMCILLLFEQVSNTPKSPRYWPKCAVKKSRVAPLFNKDVKTKKGNINAIAPE